MSGGYVGGALFIAAVLVIVFLVAKSTVSVGNGVSVPGGIPAPAIPPFPGPGN